MKRNKDHKPSMSVLFILLVSMAMTGCAGSLYPLHTAAGTGADIDKVMEFLEQGMDVNLKGRANRTPLMTAVYYGNFEIAKLLIEKGADIDTAIMFVEGVYSDKLAALAGKDWLIQYQTALKSHKPVAGDGPEKQPRNASAQVVKEVGPGQNNLATTRQKLAVLDLEAEKNASIQPSQPSPGDDKRIWVEANGESQMSELETPKEVKDRARRDAQSRAVEKAVGIFIKSHTLISNNQIADDLVYAAVRGKIEKMDVLSEGWDGKDRNHYRVKIRALVEPVYPEPGQGLSVRVALSRAVMKEGQETRVLYQANNECYIYIFSVAADGSVTLLFPNSDNKDNRLLQNIGYEFPPAGSPVRLEARFLPDFQGESAEERIKVIATRKEEPIVPLGFQEGMFKIYDAGSTGMVSDLIKRLNQLDPADWAEATVTYKIVRQGHD